MTDKQLISTIHNSPFKKGYIAKQIGMSSGNLSRILAGKHRILDKNRDLLVAFIKNNTPHNQRVI